ncbi:MAG: hypothetical protein ABL962_03165 [Fimbriimonadaceae bacterium]
MQFRSVIMCVAVFVTAICHGAVTLNQVDTFQDGSLMNWAGGSNPVNIATGGPAGAGDKYLQISATGGFLASFCQAQWIGNFTGAGVNRIEVDLRNTGANPLVVRLVLFAANFDRWSSTASVTLPANSQWVHASFNLVESNFVHTTGTGTFPAMMANMNRIMFRHEPTITSGGTAVTGQLGIDNVTAYANVTQVPPASYSIVMGILTSGVLADLFTSNDQWLSIRQNPARSRQDPAVGIQISSTAPPGQFSMLSFKLESSSNAVPVADVSQRMQLYDFQSQSFVQVDARPCTATDQVVVVDITTNPNRFIDSATREVRARMLYFEPGTLLTRSWGISFDHVALTLTRS